MDACRHGAGDWQGACPRIDWRGHWTGEEEDICIVLAFYKENLFSYYLVVKHVYSREAMEQTQGQCSTHNTRTGFYSSVKNRDAVRSEPIF